MVNNCVEKIDTIEILFPGMLNRFSSRIWQEFIRDLYLPLKSLFILEIEKIMQIKTFTNTVDFKFEVVTPKFKGYSIKLNFDFN